MNKEEKMSKAILTIDDGPTSQTVKIIDWLFERGVQPIMFFTGTDFEKNYEAGIYALRRGAIAGNHSLSHRHFSELSFEEGIEEIKAQEKNLERLYKDSNVKRTKKLFRFPYGDKGGKNAEAFQKFLKAEGFEKGRDGSGERDWLWTFDFEEYKMQWNEGWTFEMSRKKIFEKTFNEISPRVLLIHDHPQSNKFEEGYFFKLIEAALESGVEFERPF